jgi:hypothetical protein
MSAFLPNQAPNQAMNLQSARSRAEAKDDTFSQHIRILGICVSFLVCFLTACAPSGDFGRPRPSVWNEVLLPAAGDFSAYWRGVPTSAFAYTDDESELRDRAWRFVMPAHERALFERQIAKMVRTRIAPVTWTLDDETSYYPRLVAGFPRSPSSSYRRLSQDVGEDQILVRAFAPVANRVLAADRVRLRSLLYVKNLEPEEAAFAAARVAENRCVIALVTSRLQNRKAAYRYALERLVIEVPGHDAVPAERALLAFEQMPNPLDELNVGRFDDAACLGEQDEPAPSQNRQIRNVAPKAVLSK